MYSHSRFNNPWILTQLNKWALKQVVSTWNWNTCPQRSLPNLFCLEVHNVFLKCERLSLKALAYVLYKNVLVGFIFEYCTKLSNITHMSVCSLPLVMLVPVPPVLNILLTGERRGHFTILQRPVGIRPQIWWATLLPTGLQIPDVIRSICTKVLVVLCWSVCNCKCKS